MILARGSLGLMNVVERHKDHNKEYTVRVMNARDERIRLGIAHGARTLAKYTKKKINQKLEKKQETFPGD
jgi:hypothetical protein